MHPKRTSTGTCQPVVGFVAAAFWSANPVIASCMASKSAHIIAKPAGDAASPPAAAAAVAGGTPLAAFYGRTNSKGARGVTPPASSSCCRHVSRALSSQVDLRLSGLTRFERDRPANLGVSVCATRIALELLGDEFDLSRVPIAALVNELTKRTGGPDKGSWTWAPHSTDADP